MERPECLHFLVHTRTTSSALQERCSSLTFPWWFSLGEASDLSGMWKNKGFSEDCYIWWAQSVWLREYTQAHLVLSGECEGRERQRPWVWVKTEKKSLRTSSVRWSQFLHCYWTRAKKKIEGWKNLLFIALQLTIGTWLNVHTERDGDGAGEDWLSKSLMLGDVEIVWHCTPTKAPGA